MYIIAKAKQGAEYLYNSATAIQCRSEAQAREIAQHLNSNNDTAVGVWKLKAGEVWHAYEVDGWTTAARYRLKSTRGGIKIAAI